MLPWNGEHYYCPRRGQQAHAGNCQSFSLKSSGDPSCSDDDDDLDDAKGNIEEDGLEVGVSEVSDDETAKRRDTPACDTILIGVLLALCCHSSQSHRVSPSR